MKKISRKHTIRAAGFIWERWNDGWATDVNDRIYATTWQFGSIHQCKVFVRYAGAKLNRDETAICLQAQSTMRAAMEHGVAWAHTYVRVGPPTVDQVLYDYHNNWPSQYRTRADAINHLFFVIGNGYDWLDGALISTSPEDHLDYKKRVDLMKADESSLTNKSNKLFEEMLKHEWLTDELRDSLKKLIHKPFEDETPGPHKDDGKLKCFYPVYKGSSAITRVPADVRPDWLALSYEAAILLRDRSGVPEKRKEKLLQAGIDEDEKCQKKNRKFGSKIVKELEERFPQLGDMK